MTFERGELLIVPFPFSDLSATKRRPVLALTAPDDDGDFIGMPVTSRSHHRHALAILPTDLVAGALPARSWIRTDRVVTLNVSLVLRSFARLSAQTVAEAVRLLCVHLGDDAPPHPPMW